MGRPRNVVPNYLHHRASGQAYVRVRGVTTYLGPHGSPESKEAYRRVCAELAAGAVPLPPGGALTVNGLVARFMTWAKQEYAGSTELKEFKAVTGVMLPLYGTTPAAAFGPKALKAVRQKMVDAGWARATVNARVRRLRRVFRWAAAEELVPGTVSHALSAVPALPAGRGGARETEPVTAVADADVEKVLAVLPPTLAAMVRVQRLTGMRPGELCRMTPGEIDRSVAVWVYRPAKHKTRHRGKARAVNIGPRAQELLAPLLVGLADGDPVFSPAKVRAERRAAWPGMAAARGKPAPRFFSTQAFWHAVNDTCRAAGVPGFAPNRLRHARATEVRKRYGLEAAGAVLGHHQLSTTQVYAARSEDIAAQAAAESG